MSEVVSSLPCKTKHVTDDSGVMGVPLIIADSTPAGTGVDLDSPLVISASTHKSDLEVWDGIYKKITWFFYFHKIFYLEFVLIQYNKMTAIACYAFWGDG